MTKATDTNSRHWAVAVFLQIGIRIRYLFESWFFLKPFILPLSAYPSPLRPKNAPHYDFVTQIGFKLLWLSVASMRNWMLPYLFVCQTGLISVFNYIQTLLANRLIAQMEAAGYSEADREVQIPEFDWKKGDPEVFYKTYVAKPHPVVLRGFMKDTKLLKELNWDKVLSQFGEEEVMLTKKEIDGYPGKLKQVEEPSVYLHNSEKLFNKFPHLRDLMEYEKLEPFLKMKPGYEQMFVGRGGTGSPFHSAAVYNMFYMVDGVKTWWFVDPYDTFLAYPVAILGKAAYILFCLWPDQFNREAFPLFKYCPIYTTTLQPGDVLFNPPYWWHSIKNKSDKSVAVASRWHTNGICGDKFQTTEENWDIYRTGSLFFMLGFTSFQFLHSILLTPSPKFDEHMTLREKNNRYVHHQLKIHEDGGMKAFGSVSKC